jgi:transposase
MIMSNVRKIDGDQEPFWRMAIETWQASGRSVRQFCKQEGLAEPSFYFWRKRLAGASVQGARGKPEPSSFIEVSMPRSQSAAVELVLASGHTLRIPVGVDTATLSTVLSVVRSVGLC